MNGKARDSAFKSMLVVTLTALLCSILVSAAAVYLQPIQDAYADLERVRVIVEVSGLLDGDAEPSDRRVIAAFQDLTAVVLDLENGRLDAALDPESYLDGRAVDEQVPVPPDLDVARLGERPRHVTIYQVNGEDSTRVVFPVWGQGMWSTIQGYLALAEDNRSISAAVFYDHAETAGIGDRITDRAWLDGWRGKHLYDVDGELQFTIGSAGPGTVEANRVDGIAGATVTVSGVANLVRYWFGPHGYGSYVQRLRGEGDQ